MRPQNQCQCIETRFIFSDHFDFEFYCTQTETNVRAHFLPTVTIVTYCVTMATYYVVMVTVLKLYFSIDTTRFDQSY